MASTAIFVHGATLERGDALVAATPTYTVIPNVQRVGLPVGFEVDKLETTVHSSPNFTREFIPGLVTREDVPFTLRFNHTEAVHQTLQTASVVRTKVAWRVTLPLVSLAQNATYEWDGWATLSVPEAGSEVLDSDGTIVVASDITFVAEAA
jgi:hypothetical protein